MDIGTLRVVEGSSQLLSEYRSLLTLVKTLDASLKCEQSDFDVYHFVSHKGDTEATETGPR